MGIVWGILRYDKCGRLCGVVCVMFSFVWVVVCVRWYCPAGSSMGIALRFWYGVRGVWVV